MSQGKGDLSSGLTPDETKQLEGLGIKRFLSLIPFIGAAFVAPDSYREAKKRVEEITLRLLQDRPWLSSLMISIQPWHILIPNFGIDTSLMGTKYESITFRLNSICFNREGKVVRREKLDELVIKKESMISDHYSIYFLWIGEKLSRVSDKNPYKDKLEEILENMSSYLQADMENSQQKSL